MGVELTYFDIHGVAEKIRLALVLNHVEFEDVRVGMGEEWEELKPKTKYGQLPFLKIDNGPELPQSDAILRLVGTMGKNALYPQDPAEQFKVNEAINVIDDMARAFHPAYYFQWTPEAFGYAKDFPESEEGIAKFKELRETFLADVLPTHLKNVAMLLKANGNKFIASSAGPTIADCHTVAFLNQFQLGQHEHFPKGCLSISPEVAEYIERFLAIPEVAEWYKTH